MLDEEAPPYKKPCNDKQNRTKIQDLHACMGRNCLKLKIKNKSNDTICTDAVTTSHQLTVWSDLRFYPVNEEWQRQACNILGLKFVAPSNFASHRGGPDTILTHPNCRSLKKIIGGGNCLF